MRESHWRTRITKALSRLGEAMIKGAKSRLTRLVWWTVTGTIIAFVISLSLFGLIYGLTAAQEWTFLRDSWIILAIVFFLTNVLIVVRSEQQAFDPWIDIRYHAHFYAKARERRSGFLARLHRTGYPEDLASTHMTTLNRIELSVPNILLWTGSGFALLILGIAIFYVKFVSLDVTLQDWGGCGTLLFFGLILMLVGIDEGIHDRWKSYRAWKSFWISYWEYLLNTFEPAEHVSDVPAGIGDWHPLVNWRWWGEKVEFSDPEFIKMLRNKCEKVMDNLGISDKLPADTTELVDYCDRLALLSYLKKLCNEQKKDLAEITEKSSRFKRLVGNLDVLTSLYGNDVQTELRRSIRLLKLIPVARVSIEALEELLELEPLEEPDRQEAYDFAKSRLSTLWFLSESPIPDSLKWTTVFYSLASLIAAWLSPLIG